MRTSRSWNELGFISKKAGIERNIYYIMIINNSYTGLLVQDKYPVIIQGPVKQKMLKAYMNIKKIVKIF